MKTVKYSKYNLQKTAFGCPVLAVFMMFFLDNLTTLMLAVMILGIGILLAAAFQAARKLAGDRTALRYDRQQVTIITMWSETTVAWRDVKSIELSALNSYSFYGMVKVGSVNYLNFKTKGGLFGKKYSLLSDMLELSKPELAMLVDDLEGHAHLGAMDSSSPVDYDRAPTPRSGDVRQAPQNLDGFDADAALARYMRNRDGGGVPPEAVTQPDPTPLPSFGRRRDPLEGGHRGDLSVPASAAFGRKRVM
jgi:hypothetical protein